MIPGLVTSFNADGSEREQLCEIVRIFWNEDKALVKFPGNPRVYVKSMNNVLPQVRDRFTGKAA